MASSAPTAHDGDPFADRRAYPRVPVALPAFLQVQDERHSVQLLDLSAGGAKLISPLSLATGTAVTLDCGTLGRVAIVRWRSGEVIGVSFETELEAREITALIQRSEALQKLMQTRE
ncbi:hypothetical protein GCM10023264_04320 [Sphingomonas daechungensis]|uniref:PilZ domain-containing protein n=1 Tax=Sphingomonas daechungensis TaxID=1176646 RepID=A0ABX6T276_9SPHN|nr:PilZ domain-containing protein [Sphingomonas daechungensis]QNP42833.1 PilZ domain-containing protein [Sphingomonas daechungensis]